MIIFFGPPGSGKSMQGQLVANAMGYRWISSGELLRQTNKPQIIETLKSGNLVSDEIINELIFSSIGDDSEIIIDGYPRNVDQAKTLVDRYGDSISAVIALDVDAEEINKRLSLRKRLEDDAKTIQYRIDQYNATSQPILDYVTDRGVMVKRISGIGTVDEVQSRIESELNDIDRGED